MMFNALIPELAISDSARSLHFYRDILGFSVRYERPEEGFAFLELGEAQLMIDEIGKGRTFEMVDAPLEHPLGRGVNLQIKAPAVLPLVRRLDIAGVPLTYPLEEKWYRTGDRETGQRQFVVTDPDGYLLRFFEHIGTR